MIHLNLYYLEIIVIRYIDIWDSEQQIQYLQLSNKFIQPLH